MSAIKVPPTVMEGLAEVRASGEVNMLDRRGAQAVANEFGLYETVLWIEENPRDYARGIFEGFEIERSS